MSAAVGSAHQKPGRGRSPFQRHELKFPLSVARIDEIRSRIRHHVARDPFATASGRATYTVRSIYFDTDDLRFYFEKVDGVKTRRKLRVRVYDAEREHAKASLEIKRKVGRTHFKDRAHVPLACVPAVLAPNENPPFDAALLGDTTEHDRRVIEKFRYNMNVCGLHPSVLVTYDREPYIGLRTPGARVTLDQNLRSLYRPRLEDLFAEVPLREFYSGGFVLELKFDEFMPRWMADLVAALDLKPRAFSKYCHGIDAWTFHAK